MGTRSRLDVRGALRAYHPDSPSPTGSRRTPPDFHAYAAPALTRPHYWYDWQPQGDNPFLGILALSDALVVSGDSLSMCTEAAATGKPLFIASMGHIPTKHRSLHHALVIRGSAQWLDENAKLGWQPALPLQEAAAVAQAIHSRLLSH